MNEYLMSVVLVGAVATLASLFLPEGDDRMRRLLEFGFALLILLVILRPLPGLLGEDFGFPDLFPPAEGSAEEDLPEGYARMAGKVFGYVAEEVMQTVQSKAVRNVVMTGDTLVAASCDSLMSILRSDEMNALIEHERESLGDNFSAWLSAMEMSGEAVSVSDMEAYVDLVRRADNLPAVRNRCVSALRSLKNAHASLAADLAAGETDLSADLYEELVRLNRLAAQVAGMLN